MQENLFQENQQYIFDTSSFISLRQFYPEDIFKPLHESILPVFQSGKIVVLDLVLQELKDKEPDLYKFLKTTIPSDRKLSYLDYLDNSQMLIQKYYDGKGKSHNLKADPHIIACAKIEKIVLVDRKSVV